MAHATTAQCTYGGITQGGRTRARAGTSGASWLASASGIAVLTMAALLLTLGVWQHGFNPRVRTGSKRTAVGLPRVEIKFATEQDARNFCASEEYTILAWRNGDGWEHTITEARTGERTYQHQYPQTGCPKTAGLKGGLTKLFTGDNEHCEVHWGSYADMTSWCRGNIAKFICKEVCSPDYYKIPDQTNHFSIASGNTKSGQLEMCPASHWQGASWLKGCITDIDAAEAEKSTGGERAFLPMFTGDPLSGTDTCDDNMFGAYGQGSFDGIASFRDTINRETGYAANAQLLMMKTVMGIRKAHVPPTLKCPCHFRKACKSFSIRKVAGLMPRVCYCKSSQIETSTAD